MRYRKRIRGVVQFYLTSVLLNFESKGVKAWEEIHFSRRPFFETPKKATLTLWYFSNIFLLFFLKYIEGSQHMYGNGGLKL